jgi:hypothetical protein
LRITPTPFHDEALTAELVNALVETFGALGLTLRAAPSMAAE